MGSDRRLAKTGRGAGPGPQTELALVTSSAKDKALTRRRGARELAPVKLKTERIGRVAVLYELRHVLCGKPRCRKLHGPYWYAYWKRGGRVRTAYIGRRWVSLSEKAPHKLHELGPAKKRAAAGATGKDTFRT